MRSPWILLLLLAGCRAAPLAPSPEASAYSPPNELPPQLRIASLEAALTPEGVVIDAVVYSGYPGWYPQVFIDTDNNAATGFGMAHFGLERVARIVEASGDTFPIRNPNQPNGETWGAVAGYGTIESDGVNLHVVLPYDALSDSDGVAFRFSVFEDTHGNFDFVDGTVEPVIARRMTKPMR